MMIIRATPWLLKRDHDNTGHHDDADRIATALAESDDGGNIVLTRAI